MSRIASIFLAGHRSDKMSNELGYCIYAMTGLFYFWRSTRNIKLIPLQEHEKETFIRNIRIAFRKAVVEAFGDFEGELYLMEGFFIHTITAASRILTNLPSCKSLIDFIIAGSFPTGIVSIYSNYIIFHKITSLPQKHY